MDPLGWHSAAVFPEGPEKDHIINDLYRPAFEGSFRQWDLSPAVDGALREILSTCQRCGIQAVLVFLPEARVWQGWYDPAVRAGVNRYLERVSAEGGALFVDAHTWAPDVGFIDGCHLDCQGAAVFSERLGHQVLRPLLEGRAACLTPSRK